MNKIVNINNINPNNFQQQNYTIEDESLISSNIFENNWLPQEDYLEYFILDLSSTILFKNIIGYPKYKLIDNNLVLDPLKNLEDEGFTSGKFFTVYNFLKRKLYSSPSHKFYIEEISPDRTELRINTTTIKAEDINSSVNELMNEIKNSPLNYKDFHLNFGDNILLIANNILLDNTNPNNPTVLIKLYEPLPNNIELKRELWVVEQIAESKAYQIEIIEVFEVKENVNYIKGANFNLNISDKHNNSTSYLSGENISQNNSVLGSGSLLYQINSILADKGIEVNIDYTDYSNFVNFSSAQTRLENFYYKLSLILLFHTT